MADMDSIDVREGRPADAAYVRQALIELMAETSVGRRDPVSRTTEAGHPDPRRRHPDPA
jgi:hypothetical protein